MQAGTTHRCGNDTNNITSYKISVKKILWLFEFERIEYWNNTKEEWLRSAFSKRQLGLVKI